MKSSVYILSIFILISCRQGKIERSDEDHRVSSPEAPKNEDNILNIESPEQELIRWFEPTTLDTTLIFSDNLLLTLKHTDSIFINEYYLDSKTIDSLTKPYNNRHIESLKIEEYLLKKNMDFAKKDSTGLYLKLRTGEWILIPLDPNADEVDNSFEYYFKNFGFYSVRTQWGEGNGYKLVSDRDGSETYLFGRPYFSPDGEYVISVNVDIEAGYSSNGFQLFQNRNGFLENLGKFEPSSWGPYSVKWIDNQRLVLKNQTIESKNGEMKYLDFYGELKIKNGG